MLEAISHPLIDSSSKESFPGVTHFITACCGILLSIPSKHMAPATAGHRLRAQGSAEPSLLTSDLSSQVWPQRMWLPKRCCQTGGKVWGKVHPSAKYWRRGQGGKAWASHDSGPGHGHWKSGFHPSLDLGQAPPSPFACFYSQMSSAFIALFIKLFGASNWLLLSSCATLLTTGS